MASDTLHEARKDLSKETRDLHRALTSLQEELEAVDWYRQRADACRDEQLQAILLHNMREEMEHSAMLIEWLRRQAGDFEGYLRTYLFTDTPITDGHEDTAKQSPADATKAPSIGALKE